jgi:hypothetical protein
MPQLLLRAYEKFRELPDLLLSLPFNTCAYEQLSSIQTIKFFLKSIPSRRELDPYFHVFHNQSIQLLSDIMKLPVMITDSNNKQSISWVSPSQCIIIRDTFIRKILSQDLLLTHINCYYVHDELVDECDHELLFALGCRPLNSSNVAQLLEASYKSDERQISKTQAIIDDSKFICFKKSNKTDIQHAHIVCLSCTMAYLSRLQSSTTTRTNIIGS